MSETFAVFVDFEYFHEKKFFRVRVKVYLRANHEYLFVFSDFSSIIKAVKKQKKTSFIKMGSTAKVYYWIDFGEMNKQTLYILEWTHMLMFS